VPDPSRKTSASVANRSDEEARLDQIRALWIQLAQASEKSKEYRDLVQRIRREADAFRKLVEARRHDGS
jgi:hypothetical protein